MSEGPSNTTQVIVRNESNGLGVAGFVCSLVGWVSCGVLCPIGLLLSFIALFKAPRGFAIAGTIIGLLGTIFLAFFGLAIISFLLAAVGLAGAGAAFIANQVETMEAIKQAENVILVHEVENGQLPDGDEGTTLIAPFTDAWGNNLAYSIDESKPDGFNIVSAGRDGVFDTSDDIDRTDQVDQNWEGPRDDDGIDPETEDAAESSASAKEASNR